MHSKHRPIQIIHGRRFRLAPDTPWLFLSVPHLLLNHDIFGAILLLRFQGRFIRSSLQIASCTPFEEGLDVFCGLTTCDEDDYLSDTGLGKLGNYRRAIRNDVHTGEKRRGVPFILVQGPRNSLVARTSGDPREQGARETGATDFSKLLLVTSISS